jgi:chromosome segregation ATPase
MNRFDPKNVIPISPSVTAKSQAAASLESLQHLQSPLMQSPSAQSATARPPSESPIPVTPPRLFYELESIFVTVRQVEAKLLEEQERLRVAQKELFHEKTLREAEFKSARTRIQELSEQGQRLRTEVEARAKDEEKLLLQIKGLEARINTTQGELDLVRMRSDDERKRALLDQEQFKYAIGREQKRYKSLEDEYRRAYSANEKMQADLRLQLTQSIEREEAEKTKSAELQTRKQKVEERAAELQSELSTLKIEFGRLRQDRLSKEHALKLNQAELARYKVAWTEVVKRDHQMRASLLSASEKQSQLRESLSNELARVAQLQEAWEKERSRTRIQETELQELRSRNSILEEETIAVAKALKNAETEVLRVTEESERTKSILMRKLREADTQVEGLERRLTAMEEKFRAQEPSRISPSREERELDEGQDPESKSEAQVLGARMDALQKDLARAQYEREKLAFHAEKIRQAAQPPSSVVVAETARAEAIEPTFESVNPVPPPFRIKE